MKCQQPRLMPVRLLLKRTLSKILQTLLVYLGKKKSTGLRRKQPKETKLQKKKVCGTKFALAEATLFQQVKDELKYFLKTPYAEFFPENTGTSSLETCCLPDSARKKQSKISDTTGMQSDRFSEIAAWLEFFG